MKKAEPAKQVLLLEKQPPVAWIKLNRPDVLNCLNRDLLKHMIAALHDIENDREIRVAAIIGSGGSVFCAGADLQERRQLTEAETLDYISLIQRTFRTVEQLPKPVIAAINGSAFGGGTELALACDLRVMMDDALLRLTEVKLGIIPGAGGTQRLPRLIGKSKAKEMILAAVPITAQEGKSIGLIHRVVPRDPKEDVSEGFCKNLMESVRMWAEEIATAAPLSLRQAKRAIDQGFDRDLEAGLAIETRCYLELINTRDRKEGLNAFQEKRKPEYVGE